jgi:hypothetical protein
MSGSTFDSQWEVTMSRRTLAALCLIVAAGTSVPLQAQQPGELVRELSRSGPRFGITWLAPEIQDTISARFDARIQPVITQFGWQYERQFASLESGPVALNEWILLVGGLDQGIFLPSLTWLVGIRTPSQFEIGVGPNATGAGVGLALSVGKTFRTGALNVPLNLAVVPSRFGPRVSVLTGFNLYR